MTDVIYRLDAGPHQDGRLTVSSFRGREALSRLYRFDIVVASPMLDDALERTVLGKPATFTFQVGPVTRRFHGLISAVESQGLRRGEGAGDGGRLAQHRLRLVPRAWILRRRRGSRIFQDQRIDQVIATVLAEAGVSARFKLRHAYPVRRYCTQYAETDWDFVTRLAAENGLFFYFEQPAERVDTMPSAASGELGAMLPGEVMVFGDVAAAYPALDQDAGPPGGVLDGAAFGPVAAAPPLHHRGTDGVLESGHDGIASIVPRQALRSRVASYREYDPERPLTSFSARFPEASEPSVEGDEVYEHHPRDLFPDWAQAREEPRRILEQSRRRADVAHGTSTCARLHAGRRFALEDHPQDHVNREYAVTAVEHQGLHPEKSGSGPTSVYRNTFRCVPASVPFVPPRPPRRVVQACLTATVVGPGGDDIHVHHHGEIKVRFHWDRRSGVGDTSCWIRTMQTWGGAGWGTQFIPRVGMEVVVAFDGGDTDRPLVIGSVYNATHPTPFPLPADKTRSGFRTRSSPGSDGYNELSFEDRAGEEQIFLRAERDFDSVVERDRTARIERNDHTAVAHDRVVEVAGTQTTRVEKTRTTEIEDDDRLRVSGSRYVAVERDLHERVAKDHVVRIEGAARSEVLGETRTTTHGDVVVDVRGGSAMLVGRHEAPRSCTLVVEGVTQLTGSDVVDLSSDTELLLRCGKSIIRISPEEIEIASPRVVVRGDDARLSLDAGEAKIKAEKLVQLVSADKAVVKSSGASLGLGAQAKLDGEKVLLNSPTEATDDIEVSEPESTTIELVDQDGQALAYERFRIQLEDGSQYVGFLDENGRAEVDVEGAGEITFPDLTDLEEA